MLRYTDITGAHIDKVQTAIDRLKAFEPEDGYYLAFSGGKDSCCIKELANMAGVKYDAHYSATTIDPPELVRFIVHQHHDVEIVKPELSMRKLIVKRGMLPLRNSRYCCAVLKETGGEGRIVVTGVRWAESPRRRKQHGVARVGTLKKAVIMNDDNDENRMMVEQCYRTKKTMVNPIVDWEDGDVWDFIHERKLPYCSLYDEGKKRLGCVACPMAGKQEREDDLKRWPQYEKLYKNAIAEMIEKQKSEGKSFYKKFDDANEMFDWWMERKVLGPAGQTEMEYDDEQI